MISDAPYFFHSFFLSLQQLAFSSTVFYVPIIVPPSSPVIFLLSSAKYKSLNAVLQAY